MTAIRAYYNGKVFVPEDPPLSATVNQKAIITLLDNAATANQNKEYLLGLAGRISKEDCRDMEQALEYTEEVHLDEW
jgi:hypothetical protein